MEALRGRGGRARGGTAGGQEGEEGIQKGLPTRVLGVGKGAAGRRLAVTKRGAGLLGADRSARGRNTVLCPPPESACLGRAVRCFVTGGGGVGRPEEGGGGRHDAVVCFGLQLAAPIGRSPLTALPLPFASTGGGAHRPLNPL